jgi:tmRNA-binding protein
MLQSTKLTEKEKQNGKRKLLIPSKEIQELMEPITEEEFAALVDKAIPPSPQPDSETH